MTRINGGEAAGIPVCVGLLCFDSEPPRCVDQFWLGLQIVILLPQPLQSGIRGNTMFIFQQTI